MSWKELSFTEVFDIQGGTQPPKSQFKDTPRKGYVRLLQIRDFGEKPVPTYIPDSKTLKKCDPTDVLIGRYGASVGRICTGMEGAYNVALAKVINEKKIDTNYLKFWLESENFQAPLRKIQRTAQNGFNKDDLSRIVFRYPESTEKQASISKWINHTLSEMDVGTQELESAKQKLELYRQSILNASACGDVTTLEEILDDDRGIFDGPFGSNLKSSDYTPSGVRVIRLENIGALDFKNEATYISKKKYESLKKHTVFSGDIVFSSFVAEKVRACFIPDTIQFAVNKADCFCLRPNKNLIKPEFLLYQICSPSFYQNLISEVKGVTRPRVNTKILRQMPLYLPDLKKQEEIIRFIKESLSATAIAESEITRSQQKIVQFKQSILKKAFEGNL